MSVVEWSTAGEGSASPEGWMSSGIWMPRRRASTRKVSKATGSKSGAWSSVSISSASSRPRSWPRRIAAERSVMNPEGSSRMSLSRRHDDDEPRQSARVVPRLRDARDAGARRALPQGDEETVQEVSRPLGLHADGAVPAVLDRAGDVERPGGLENERAESDSLDPAVNVSDQALLAKLSHWIRCAVMDIGARGFEPPTP